ncbi:MAG TPA: SMP-30/gluconolactonase/LRE family protein [Saprospiraceae bacterium]|nr:SMP-30/gluconolactonase/LRE family protein [Saprospiraceae bacterium]
MTRNQIAIASLFYLATFLSCKTQAQKASSMESKVSKTYQTTGSIEVLDNSLLKLIDADSPIQILATGFNWSEGPLWVKEINGVIFSDVPENTVYKWTEADSISVYLKPSGYTDTIPRGGEMGSNGLTLSRDRKLILAQHGNRAIAQMDAPLKSPKPKFINLAEKYDGMKFSSPNDVIVSKNGTLFFTDPPYGLVKQQNDPKKETPFNGIYMKKPGGQVELIDDKVSRPNGIALSMDESKLYVASSDPSKAIWMEYSLDANFKVTSSKELANFTELGRKVRGLPDGMKVHSSGNLFATGPGGVVIIDPMGKHLGTILTGRATSNCAFDDDEKYLYMTADDYLLRVKLK